MLANIEQTSIQIVSDFFAFHFLKWANLRLSGKRSSAKSVSASGGFSLWHLDQELCPGPTPKLHTCIFWGFQLSNAGTVLKTGKQRWTHKPRRHETNYIASDFYPRFCGAIQNAC